MSSLALFLTVISIFIFFITVYIFTICANVFVFFMAVHILISIVPISIVVCILLKVSPSVHLYLHFPHLQYLLQNIQYSIHFHNIHRCLRTHHHCLHRYYWFHSLVSTPILVFITISIFLVFTNLFNIYKLLSLLSSSFPLPS